jgi:hypothetical protein
MSRCEDGRRDEREMIRIINGAQRDEREMIRIINEAYIIMMIE